MRLLLVEDDGLIGEGIRGGLRQDGFVVDWVQAAEDAELALRTEPYALLILDLGLPGMSGLDLLRQLRREGDSIPVLILTAWGELSDRVEGLDSGADDYLIKPVDLEELGARIRALLRRSAGRAQPVLKNGDVVLDPAGHRVTLRDEEVSLSAREFALILALMERPGAIFSRQQLEEALYGWGDEVGSNVIEVHVSNLRKKLGHGLIKTVRGLGYMMERRP